MREPKKRIIYGNYDLWDVYADDVSEYLLEINPEKEPTENAIWEEIYICDETEWSERKADLREFFDDGSTWLLIGSVGLWSGTYAGGFTFKTFDEMFDKVSKDCDYWSFWDENGHFYGQCSHHDGTNYFEIKKMSEQGVNLLDDWEYAESDSELYLYSERQIHEKIWEEYASLPEFVHRVFGCAQIEYEDETA